MQYLSAEESCHCTCVANRGSNASCFAAPTGEKCQTETNFDEVLVVVVVVVVQEGAEGVWGLV